MPVIKSLFEADTIVLWLPPLVLAILLIVIRHFFDRPWLVPVYYISITAIFYIVTTAVPSISMDDLRSSGWVFEAPASGVPFYNFYQYYNFRLVDWKAIWSTIPSQLALTFFGILHVPINIPNLVCFLSLVVPSRSITPPAPTVLTGIRPLSCKKTMLALIVN